MKLIDVHAHLQFPQFDSDREQVIQRAREAEIGVINVGTDLETSRAAVKLAETYPDMMWATVGIHPADPPEANEFSQTFVELEKLARRPRVVGIGECGLDVRGEWQSEIRKKQIKIFEQQIELSKQVSKPLMLHIRNAYDDLFSILASYHSPPVSHLHFFAGDWPTARKFLDLGCTLSFTGVITFTHDYDEVIKNASLEQIMVETDCPFVAPAPHRGRRNEPSYAAEAVRRIAALRGASLEAVASAVTANARRVFGLDF